jgi:hypothetical protein
MSDKQLQEEMVYQLQQQQQKSQDDDQNFEKIETREDDRMEQDEESASQQTRETSQEQPVMLLPRFSFSYDDISDASRLASYGSPKTPEAETRESPTSTAFLCTANRRLPSSPSSASGIRSKPALLRSLAWSQDSQEERRETKRKKEDPLKTPPSSSSEITSKLGQRNRRDSSSPTMVHWEEKIEIMELSDVLHKAIQQTSLSPP